MRKNIQQLCVTDWGAVLELKKVYKFAEVALVADPYAVDAGQFIGINEIVLIARKKHTT